MQHQSHAVILKRTWLVRGAWEEVLPDPLNRERSGSRGVLFNIDDATLAGGLDTITAFEPLRGGPLFSIRDLTDPLQCTKSSCVTCQECNPHFNTGQTCWECWDICWTSHTSKNDTRGVAAPVPDQTSWSNTPRARSRWMGQFWALLNLRNAGVLAVGYRCQLEVRLLRWVLRWRSEVERSTRSCYWHKKGGEKWRVAAVWWAGRSAGLFCVAVQTKDGLLLNKRRRSHTWLKHKPAGDPNNELHPQLRHWLQIINAHVAFHTFWSKNKCRKDAVSYSVRQRVVHTFDFYNINHLSKNSLFHFQPGSCLMGREILRWILLSASALLCCVFN